MRRSWSMRVRVDDRYVVIAELGPGVIEWHCENLTISRAVMAVCERQPVLASLAPAGDTRSTHPSLSRTSHACTLFLGSRVTCCDTRRRPFPYRERYGDGAADPSRRVDIDREPNGRFREVGWVHSDLHRSSTRQAVPRAAAGFDARALRRDAGHRVGLQPDWHRSGIGWRDGRNPIRS